MIDNSFPPVNAILNQMKKIDYVKVAHQVMDYSVIVYAVIVGLCSYLYTAFQLWWDDNGETVKVNTIRIVVNLIDFIGAIVIVTPKVYRWVKLNINRVVDTFYFQFAY